MMHVLPSLLVLACTASVSLSSPLHVHRHPSYTASSSGTILHTFNTGPQPTNYHFNIRPQHHRHLKLGQQPRDTSPYTEIFWAFGNSEPKPSDLPPIPDVLEAIATDIPSSPSPSSALYDATAPTASPSQPSPIQQTAPSPGITVIASPTAGLAAPINVNPKFEGTGLPLAAIPIATSSPSGSDANNSTYENPATVAAQSHQRKIAYVAVVVGIISGLGITVAVCKFFARTGLCNFGGRKFTGAGRVKDIEKHLSWMRLSNPPANFGTGSLFAGVLQGRHYDEKGIERNFNHKGVSFEDEIKVIDIGHEFVGPDLPTLAYQPPSSNGSAATATPSNPSLGALGLKVGQTLDPAHFTTVHLAPTSFFDNDDHVISASSSRLSNVSSAHSRTKSAPIMTDNGRERRESNKSSSAVSSKSSEWDIARAYGGPRYDKARSAGAMSGMSVDEREWERIQRISDNSSR